MGLCPDKLDEEAKLRDADKNRVQTQDSGTSIALSSSALDALERMKAKEEEEKKVKPRFLKLQNYLAIKRKENDWIYG